MGLSRGEKVRESVTLLGNCLVGLVQVAYRRTEANKKHGDHRMNMTIHQFQAAVVGVVLPASPEVSRRYSQL